MSENFINYEIQVSLTDQRIIAITHAHAQGNSIKI